MCNIVWARDGSADTGISWTFGSVRPPCATPSANQSAELRKHGMVAEGARSAGVKRGEAAPDIWRRARRRALAAADVGVGAQIFAVAPNAPVMDRVGT